MKYINFFAPQNSLLQISEFGLHARLKNCLVFFGNSNFNKEKLNLLHPNITFCELHQIHSNKCWPVLEPGELDLQGDALQTELKQVGLVIKTADCIPIIVSSPKKIASVHAGWRGLECGVIENGLANLKINSDCLAFVGPHILGGSFEVGNDVADQLANCFVSSLEKLTGGLKNEPLLAKSNFLINHPNPEKTFVDLQLLACVKLLALGFSPQQIHINEINTKTTPTWNSFRRDGAASGRNLSFCALH